MTMALMNNTNVSAAFRLNNIVPSSSSSSSSILITIPSPSSISKSSSTFPSHSLLSLSRINNTNDTSVRIFSLKKRHHFETIVQLQQEVEEEEEEEEEQEEMGKLSTETSLLYSFSPLPLLVVAALPGAGTIRSLSAPIVEVVKSLNLPEWLVHWGHPGNMAVVLFAMGGYGTYLGFRIKFSDDVEEKAKAKDLHPKLLAGMFFFFALGATGGVTSLLTSDKPILESPHAVTGLIGLSLLTIQTILPSLFEGNPGLRNVHGILGSGIMTLFLVHAALGLQLGLSS